jgi:hypothetical protein
MINRNQIISKLKNLIMVIFLCQFSSFSQLTLDINKPKHSLASLAYGYLTAQNESLSYIENKFPELQIEVMKARLSFSTVFGRAEKRLSTYLKEYLGTTNFNTVKDCTLNQQLLDKYSNLVTQEIAKDFIFEVEQRAKGQIPSPILETICAFNFKNNPVEEFSMGLIKKFNTKEHVKANGVDLTISLPISWKMVEGERPHVLHKFISDFGFGSEIVLLLIFDEKIPNLDKLSKEDLDAIYTEENFKKSIPSGARFISFTKSKIDNITTGIVELEMEFSENEFPMKQRVIQHSFFCDGKTILIQFSVNSTEINEDLTVKLANWQNLFKLIANSVVVNSQWKK